MFFVVYHEIDVKISVFIIDVHQQEEQHHGESQVEAPENNPQFTTVYVGNLAHEV